MSKQVESVDYAGYGELLQELKQCISTARIKASLAVNKEMLHLYWQIGRKILQKTEEADFGDKVLEVLSRDLRAAFPKSKGYSVRNLKYMRQLAKAYPEFGQQLAAQIPWGHNMLILDKINKSAARQWYAAKTIENGWSRSVLEVHIRNRLYEREGQAITNFEEALPAPQSDLAQQMTRDPYCFDFLTLRQDFLEKELEGGLAEQVRKMLTAMGSGFAFLGTQYPIKISDTDYFMDMLFYHVKLHCYCVVELKATEFKPEYTGKLNFYLSAVDDLLRGPEDNPTIGMLLCQGKDSMKVKYALQGLQQPMGVSSYYVNTIESALPSQEELTAMLEAEIGQQPVAQLVEE